MAKKKKKKQSRPSGADAQQRKRERLEKRREQKAEAMVAARRADFRRRLIRGMIYAGIAVVIVWFFFFRTQEPQEIDGHEIQHFRETGTNQHVTGTVEYETTPPVAGPHAGSWADCGVHDQPIPNENFVHSLEHGTVAVLYQPELDIETIGQIEELVSSFEERTISAPYPGMNAPIVVASWGEKMELNEFDRQAVRSYIEAFRGKGPEDAPCDNTAERPFQPPEEAPAPDESPAPEASPAASPTGEMGSDG